MVTRKYVITKILTGDRENERNKKHSTHENASKGIRGDQSIRPKHSLYNEGIAANGKHGRIASSADQFKKINKLGLAFEYAVMLY